MSDRITSKSRMADREYAARYESFVREQEQHLTDRLMMHFIAERTALRGAEAERDWLANLAGVMTLCYMGATDQPGNAASRIAKMATAGLFDDTEHNGSREALAAARKLASK